MNVFTIVCLSLFELVGLILLVRLWMRRPLRLLSCLFWSCVLLVPFFGLLVYGLLYEIPDAHSDNVPDTYHTGSSSADGGD